MMKKIIYITVIIILIIAGVYVAKQMSGENEIIQTGTNTQNTTNKITEKNEVEEKNTIEENEIQNNTIENEEVEVLPEEQAKKIVMENWGEDNSVYYSYDGKDENGRYVICVREKSTTKALYRYYVDIATGTFEIE